MKVRTLVISSLLVSALLASQLLVSPLVASSKPDRPPYPRTHPISTTRLTHAASLTVQQTASAALYWIQAQQNLDGSQGETPGQPTSAVGSTCDAVLAYVAAGYDPATVHASTSTTSLIAYLETNGNFYAVGTSPDQAGKLAMTVKAAGLDPTNFAYLNLITTIESYYSTTSSSFVGSDQGDSWYQSFAILGLVANGNPAPSEVAGSALALRQLQQPDGGWSYDTAYPFSDPSSTGIAMEALAASGVPSSDPAIVKAEGWLKSNQDGVGGWSDANDTAYAMQGLLAVGENLTANWSQNNLSPYQALQAYQNPDGAFFWSAAYSTADNGLATWQAVPALLGISYPYTPKSALVPFVDPTVRSVIPVVTNNLPPGTTTSSVSGLGSR